MKKQLLLALACLIGLSTSASTMDTIRPPRPKVGVVLGGGGAKGATHIGVLKYLEELGIPVDYVAGTSMGSIIGGFYSLGYSPDELAELIANMNWSAYVGNSIDRQCLSAEMRHRDNTTLINIPFGNEDRNIAAKDKNLLQTLPTAYVNNAALINLFNDLSIGYQRDVDFNDLPIPFACVATDVITGEEVVLRSGSISTAMRASMAIPGVFSPVEMNGKVLVDGGLVNNFPADVLREMGADIIIGVEVTNEKKFSPDMLQSLPQLLGKLFLNIVNAKREENRKLCDIHMVPDITGYGMLSFTPEAIDTLVNRGYKKATEYHDQLMVIKQYVDKCAGTEVKKELRAPRAKDLQHDSVFIRSITLNKTMPTQSKWLIRKGGLKAGQFMSEKDIQKAIDIYRGTGAFDGITYNVTMDTTHSISKDIADEAYDLSIDFKPAKPHVVGVGFRYDNEEGAAILVNLGLNEKKLSGFKCGLDARLAYNPKIKVSASYSSLALASFNVGYRYWDQSFDCIGFNTSKYTNINYISHYVDANITQFHLINTNVAVGFFYQNTDFSETVFEDYDTLSFRRNNLFGPYLKFEYDNKNDAYFATKGILLSVYGDWQFDKEANLGSTQSASLQFQSFITPGGGRFTLIPQVYSRFVFGSVNYRNQWNTIGGEMAGRYFDSHLPFVGIRHSETACDKAAILRCDLRYNFHGKHYLTAMFNYLQSATDLKTDAIDYYRYNYFGAGLRYSYNTIIGPIGITGQWYNKSAQKGKAFSIYFSLGYDF